jgi:hypothetical protein
LGESEQRRERRDLAARMLAVRSERPATRIALLHSPVYEKP